MFKLAEKNEVLWPVTVPVPQDGGTVTEVEIQIRYKLLTRSRMDELPRLPAKEQDGALLDHITGWEGVQATDGKDVPFSRDNLIALLDIGPVQRAVVRGLYEASRGAPAKN